MSLYEGLSLVLTTLGTMFTVWLGFRQLRQTAPATAGPVPAGPPQYVAAPPAGRPPPGYGVAPVSPPGTPYGRAPAPPAPAPYPPYGPPRPHVQYHPPQAWTARRVRPQSVTAASVLLFVAAALQPIALIAYYGI